jgi:glycosyltransferase involved in cell wall biosynthesis
MTRSYREEIRRAGAVIGNSWYSRTILWTFYDLASDLVAYPPVTPDFLGRDREVYQRQAGRCVLYVGNPGELRPEQLARVAERCSTIGLSSCDAFGDPLSIRQFSRFFKGECTEHGIISDEEMAALYSRATITIAPQRWETFGYVGPESILCGTPVLMDTYQPWLEITGPGRFARYLGEEPSSLRNDHSGDEENAAAELALARQRLSEALSPEKFAETVSRACSIAQARFVTRKGMRS